MHIKVPFLAVLFMSLFQLSVFAVENDEYSAKNFAEIFPLNQTDISEITVDDYSSRTHSIKDKARIEEVLHYFDQFQYKRLRNDQTSFMPDNTLMIHFDDGERTTFIIPYKKEMMLDNKVYKLKGGELSEEKLLDLFDIQ